MLVRSLARTGPVHLPHRGDDVVQALAHVGWAEDFRLGTKAQQVRICCEARATEYQASNASTILNGSGCSSPFGCIPFLRSWLKISLLRS